MKHIIDFNQYSINEEGPWDFIGKLGRQAWRAGRRLFGKGGKVKPTALPKLGLLQRVNQNQYSKIFNALTRNPKGLRYLNFQYTIADKIDDVYNQLTKLGYGTRDIDVLKLFIKQIGEKKFVRFWNAVSRDKLRYEKMTQEQLMNFIQDKLVEIEKISMREFRKRYPKNVMTQADQEKRAALVGWGSSFLINACLIFVLSKCTFGGRKKEDEPEQYGIEIDWGGGGGQGMPAESTKPTPPTGSRSQVDPKIIRGDEEVNIPPDMKQKIEKTPLLKDTISKPSPPTPKPVDLGDGGSVGRGGTGKGGGEGSGSGTGNGSGRGSGDSRGTSIYNKPGINMGGWIWREKPELPKSDEKGKIIFKVTVKSNGYVRSIDVIESTVSDELTKTYKKIISETVFINKHGGEEGGSGTVTFILK